MRPRSVLVLFVAFALLLAGCVGAPAETRGLPSGGPTAVPTAPLTVAEPTEVRTPGPAAASAAAGDTLASVQNAIKEVIQRANEAQQQAFASNDPTVMRQTATEDYYGELRAINQSLSRGGVSAIELVGIEWGDVNLTSATGAQAITHETWQTTFADGTTQRSRDQNVYGLVLQSGVWKIASDEHPASAPAQAGGSSATAPSSPGTPPPATAEETDTSRNWSGYVATGGTFTAVTGTWTVPESGSSGAFGSSAAWVGIGGVKGRDLIQAGTMQMSDGSGTTRYSAWIETLPAAAETVPLVVRPGDSVTVSIAREGTNLWQMTLKNNTTGKDYSRTVEYASSLSSAEWIQEAPSIGRRIVNLDDFDSVQFSEGSTVKDGRTLSIAQAGGEPVAMAGAQGNAVAVPSDLTADGGGFSVHQTEGNPAPRTAPNRRALPLRPAN